MGSIGSRGSVRVRVTATAVLVVGLALLAASVALVLALRAGLEENVRAGARAHAARVAAGLADGSAGGPAGGSAADLAVGAPDEQLVQVLDGAGRVVAASPNVAGRPPVARLAPGESARVAVPVDDDDFLAVAVAADSPQGPRTVLVAHALADVLESTQLVTRLLAVGWPVLVLVVAAATWWLAGRSLAPVEAIRRRVATISAADLSERVPRPAGTDEVSRLADTMNRMLDRLQRAQDGQRRFVSDASHELRSPIAAIRQHAEVALAHPDRTGTRELAEAVLAEDLRLQGLVDDLLLLARADEHGLRPHRRPVDVDDLVLAEARHLRATTAVRVDTRGVSAGRVDGDEVALRRVLRNLGDNAARHARSALAFELSEAGDDVRLAVEDDGPGIPAEERERVLDRFVRLAGARARDDGGSGLGLAIVAELVRAHGGEVTVTAGALGGARVEVRLPRGTG
jgi:signal transduction histidine kinase